MRAGLAAHNARAGDPTRRPLVLAARDAAGAVQGGMVAEVTFGWLYIERFWVAEAWRGRGLGARLLAAAEAAARERGAIGAHLHSSTFQAPGFYIRQGYSEIGRLPDRPVGHHRIWFAKRWDGGALSLAPPPPAAR